MVDIRVLRNNDEIILDQSAYVKTVPNKFRFIDCNSINTQMESKLNYKFWNIDGNSNTPCRRIICSLVYLMRCTKPDWSFCASLFRRYMSKSSEEFW